MKFKRFAVVTSLMIAIALSSACAEKTKVKLQQADLSIYNALTLIQKTERDIFNGNVLCGTLPCINQAAHQKFSGYLLTALQSGKTFHLTVAAWQEGQPVPLDIQQLSVAMASMADVIKTLVPESPQRDQIRVVIDAATFAINQALVLLLPKGEADTLFPVPASLPVY